MKNTLAVFENFKIRRIYDEKSKIWFFSVVDIIAVLIEQREHKKAQSYWTTLKNRLKEEGSEVVTKCDQLKMEATGMEENKAAGKKGGSIAKKARLDLEEKTGKRVVSWENYLPPNKSAKKLNGGEK